MKKKELKEIAKKIAKAETIIQTSEDAKKIREARESIIELSGHVNNLDDMIIIDELVQDILKQKI